MFNLSHSQEIVNDFSTSLLLRWQRAKQSDPASIEPLGLGWYVVPSSRAASTGGAHITYHWTGLTAAILAHCAKVRK